MTFSPSELRIIDASVNRCSEALRVVEDVCRFHWDLAGPSRELKELRHRLLGIFAPGVEGRARLVRHRDVEGDSGREAPGAVEAAGEAGPAVAAVRNLQRAREALRTLEEISRLRSPEDAARVAALRYRLYEVERCVLHLVADRRSLLADRRLCLLATRSLCAAPLEEVVVAAIECGVDVVQLREKELPDAELVAWGRRLRELTAARGVTLFVNDRPDVALLVGADGVHVGQSDLSPGEVRRIAGPDLLVGVSTHSLAEARKAVRAGADCIGVGPVFLSSTKDAGPCLGIDGLREILGEVDVPAFAIGGIGPGNIDELAAAGIARAAVSSAVLRGENAAAAGEVARVLRSALDRAAADRESRR